MNNTHTIFGAGQIGLLLARHLASQGIAVRLVRRGSSGPAIDGVTWLSGDATDAAFALEACRGAKVVYNCANPSDYGRWDGIIQPLYCGIWRAASRAGARLVQLDSLYAYGRPDSVPFDESTPERPCSSKGEIRHELTAELMEMHARGELVATVGRASDFFGSDAPNTFVTRPDVLDTIRRGGSVYVPGNPDMPHSYTFIPDVVRGLAILGARSAAWGRIWHLPTTHAGTTRQLVDALAHVAGTRCRARGIPTWLLRTAGVFSPLARALAEMAYQFEIPYVLDDRAFCNTFGVEPTPFEEALAHTLGRQVDPASSLYKHPDRSIACFCFTPRSCIHGGQGARPSICSTPRASHDLPARRR